MSTTPAQETKVHLIKDTCPLKKTRYKPRRRRMDFDQPNTADVPKIEVGVAPERSIWFQRFLGTGCYGPAEWEKKLVRLLLNLPSLCFHPYTFARLLEKGSSCGN